MQKVWCAHLTAFDEVVHKWFMEYNRQKADADDACKRSLLHWLYIFLQFFIWTSPFNLRQSQLNQCNGFPSHSVTKKLFPQLSPSSYFVNVVAFYPCTPQPSKRENYKYKYCALEIQILCTRNAIQIFVLYYYILGSTLNFYLRFLR